MISVCLASYNGAHYIQQQIHSVLSQMSDTDEIIIADDGSSDDTLKKIIEINDSRIRVLPTGSRVGVVKNFEKALSEAKGEIIFLCDQDDVWLPNKLNICVSALNDYLLVVTDCVVVDQNLNTLHPSFFELRDSGAGLIRNLWKNSYLGCCMAFRRELLDFSLPIPSNVPMHDIWLGLTAELRGRVLFIDKKLSLYRRHQFAASPTAMESPFTLMQQFQMRLILIYHLVLRYLKYILFSKWIGS